MLLGDASQRFHLVKEGHGFDGDLRVGGSTIQTPRQQPIEKPALIDQVEPREIGEEIWLNQQRLAGQAVVNGPACGHDAAGESGTGESTVRDFAAGKNLSIQALTSPAHPLGESSFRSDPGPVLHSGLAGGFSTATAHGESGCRPVLIDAWRSGGKPGEIEPVGRKSRYDGCEDRRAP